MTQSNNSFFLYLFLISLSDVAQYVSSYRALGPHNADSYSIRTLMEERICHPLEQKLDFIRIGDHSIHSHNFPILLGSSYVFDRWVNRTSDLKCKFVVKVHKGDYLMAVIQNIAFRKDGSECLDYVQFRRKDHHHTKRFCEQFDLQKMKHLLDDPSAELGEYDIDGEIETTIFVSKRSLRPDETPLNLTIAYTPYRSKADCERIIYENMNLNNNIFLPGTGICLDSDHICDGIFNCIPAICRDERNCNSESSDSRIGSKVTIAAVSTILLGFIIFIMGLWICRRHKKLCWSSDCAGPDVNENRCNNGERASNSPNQSVPTAPMLEVSVLSTSLNKDLPPSYDSLFPEHTNPSST